MFILIYKSHARTSLFVSTLNLCYVLIRLERFWVKMLIDLSHEMSISQCIRNARGRRPYFVSFDFSPH